MIETHVTTQQVRQQVRALDPTGLKQSQSQVSRTNQSSVGRGWQAIEDEDDYPGKRVTRVTFGVFLTNLRKKGLHKGLQESVWLRPGGEAPWLTLPE